MSVSRIPFVCPVQPWLRDHHFNGRVIFPAVEAISLLARSVEEMYPGHNVRIMASGRFSRFLEIAPGQQEISGQIELERSATGEIRASLGTRRTLRTMTRTTIHCELNFPTATASVSPGVDLSRPADTQAVLEVPCTRLYRDLVPFGPAYRSLQGTLCLAGSYAWGTLQAPDPPGRCADLGPLGNPWPFDGAMHAACVHGQGLVDFVPFPVGFATRCIHQPTRAGERYSCFVQLQSMTTSEVMYALQIRDQRGQNRETISGLRMRDVTGGKIRSPLMAGKDDA